MTRIATLGLFVVVSLSIATRAQAQPATKPATQPVVSAPAPALPGLDSPNLVTLFDGKTLDGWDFNPQTWTLVDGAMHGTGKGGNIWSKGDYGSFRLIVTSRVASPPGDDGHNHLGILFWGDHQAEGKLGNNNAVQVQPPHGAMWDYHKGKGNLKVEKIGSTTKPRYQDWHTIEILANLSTGEIRCANDGVEIMKFKYPDPTVLKKGPIGMQIHAATGIFEYKDVKIESDPKEPEKFLTVKQ